MLIVQHHVHGFWGWGADTGFTGSITVNMAPASILAQVGYHRIAGSGLHAIGIKKFRSRPSPDGAEQEFDFGNWPNWPHTIAEHRVTSVTFGIALGARQEAHCYGNLYWWA